MFFIIILFVLNNKIIMSTPYQILDLKEDSSYRDIKIRYRTLCMVLHPDKNVKVGVSYYDDMSKREKCILFDKVTKAFNTLRTQKKKEKLMPLEDIEYNIDEEYRQTEEVDKKKFDKNFEEYKKYYDNPYDTGYSEFNNKAKDIEYKNDTSRKFKKPNKKSTKSSITISDSGSNSNFYELGITNVSDFSFSSSSKNGLSGYDLGSSYTNTITDVKNFKHNNRTYKEELLNRKKEKYEPCNKETHDKNNNLKKREDMIRSSVQTKRDNHNSNISNYFLTS